MVKATDRAIEIVARNKRAGFDYFLEESFEAGLVLTGTEVKSLRTGRASIGESYAEIKDNEAWLVNAHIPEYQQAGKHLNHQPTRPRKLLLQRKQIKKILGATKQKGVTLIPIKLYFNERGIAKLHLALATGKKQHDKRETLKQRDWDREKQRLMRDKG